MQFLLSGMNFKAIYPGTFDPITYGHLDVISRAAVLFPNLLVAVASNPLKQPFFSLETRVACVEDALRHLPEITVCGFDGLLVNDMQRRGVKYIIRGLRSTTDFEYENQLAAMNHELCHDVETIFFPPSPQCMFVSSSLVREIHHLGGEVDRFVPSAVVAALDDIRRLSSKRLDDTTNVSN